MAATPRHIYLRQNEGKIRMLSFIGDLYSYISFNSNRYLYGHK